MIHDGSLVLWYCGFYFKMYFVFAVFAAVSCMLYVQNDVKFWILITYYFDRAWMKVRNLFVASKMLKISTSEYQWMDFYLIWNHFFGTKSSSRGNVKIFFCFIFLGSFSISLSSFASNVLSIKWYVRFSFRLTIVRLH